MLSRRPVSTTSTRFVADDGVAADDALAEAELDAMDAWDDLQGVHQR